MRGHTARAQRALLIPALLGLYGCATTLRPYRAQVARSGGFAAELVAMERAPFGGPAGGELSLKVRLSSAPAGAKYLGATLVSDAAPACGAGLLALRSEVLSGSLRPLTHDASFALVFALRGSPPALGASRLDLAFALADGSERCVRLPVTRRAPERDWEQTPQLTWAGGASVEYLPAAEDGIDVLATVPIGAGIWLGRLHPRIEVGLAAGHCTGCSAGIEEPDGLGVPLHAAAGVETWLASFAAHQVALGAGVFYRVASVWSAPGDDTRYDLLHGVTLRGLIALTSAAPFSPERERAYAMPQVGLELPAGVLWDERGHASPTFGLGLRFGGAF